MVTEPHNITVFRIFITVNIFYKVYYVEFSSLLTYFIKFIMEDEDLISVNTSREWPYLSCSELVAKPVYLYVHVNFLVCILLYM